MPKYRISLPEAPGEEYEVDAPEGADFDEIENEIRQQRTREKAQLSAKAALDKAVKPVRTLGTPLVQLEEDDSPNVRALKRYAGGLLGPAIGGLAGAPLGPWGAALGAFGGIGAQTPAELTLTAIPSPKVPVKLPGVLGKVLGPSVRKEVPEALKKLLPGVTPYESAFKARVANAIKGGAQGALEGTARGTAERGLETGDVNISKSDALAGGALGAIAGAANIRPIEKTLKQQGDVRLAQIDKEAQSIREAKLAAERTIEKQREEAAKAVRPNIKQTKTDIATQEKAMKAVEDTLSSRHATVKADRELLTAKEAALDQIVAERAAQGKTRPTKVTTTLKQEIDQLKTKLATAATEETADIQKLQATKDSLNKNRALVSEFTEKPQDYEAKIKMMVEDHLASTPSRAGSKKTQIELETELLDKINKGELDMEKLAGQVRELSSLYEGKKREDLLGSITGELAYHAYQMARTGPVRAALGGLGAAIARSDPEKRALANAWLSRKMSAPVLQNINKFMEGAIRDINEEEVKYQKSKPESDQEETPSSRQALLEAIATQEGYYSEKPDARPRRNKNPGMLRGKEGFYMYPTDEEGWAALSDLLDKNAREGYVDKETKERKKHTLRSYISQHAPPEDNNDTEAYIRNTIERLKKNGISVSEDTLLEELLAQ